MMEFDGKEYRILADTRDTVELFMRVEIDNVAHTVSWPTLDPKILHQYSLDVDTMI